MSVTDEVLKANENYTGTFDLGHLPMPPARKLAIVACMDARLTVEQALGLKTGEAHIIRNAGGRVTEDALRSLIISHHLLGTQEFIIINHTDCGMLTFKDEDLRVQLQEKTGLRRWRRCISTLSAIRKKMFDCRVSEGSRIRGSPNTFRCGVLAT